MAEIYFKQPRLQFSVVTESLIRLISYVWYAFFVAGTFFLFFSENPRFVAFAVLSTLFLVDRFRHTKDGERTIRELQKMKKMNLADVLTPSAFRTLYKVVRWTMGTGQDFHLLLAKELGGHADIKEALRRLDINPKDFLIKVDDYLKKGKETRSKEDVFEEVRRLVEVAYGSAVDTSERYIETRNIFVALTTVKDPDVVKLFDLFEISTAYIGEAVIFGRWKKKISGIRRIPAVLGGFVGQSRAPRNRVMNRAWTARPTPTLDQTGTDLTNLARAEKIGFLIGHAKEYEHLLQILARPGKPNAILVGDPGAGKSTIIAHLAYQMTKDDVPPVLFDKRLISLDIAELVSGTTSEKIGSLLQQVAEEIVRAGNIVLFLPNVHNLFKASERGMFNANDILLPILKNAEIPVITETFPREFKQFVEPHSEFLEQFEVVNVNEISEAEALRFLVYSSLIFEKEYNIVVTFRALRRAIEIAHRYFRSRLLPGSAVDLVKQALGKAQQEKLKFVTEETIIAVAERQSKIPIQQAGSHETETLLNLESLIHEKLVNQTEAVTSVAKSLREYRSGLSRKGGPIATFLFVGPTGVGKTELSKILAKIQFGSKDAMIRFDMSEYQDKQSIFRLIGTPNGDRTGALTDAVLEKPYSLVLLDEFEKASPDVFNIFLQVFDDGRLTDSLGRTVSFENTIFIATSNADSTYIKEEVEKGRTVPEISVELKKRLTNFFKPELINRFSNIIVFRSLTEEELYSVTKLLLKDLSDLLMETQGIELQFHEDAVRELTKRGYSPVFGARPLRQTISEHVKSELSEKILRKEIGRGNVIQLVYTNGQFQFNIEE